jgi:TonB family protein
MNPTKAVIILGACLFAVLIGACTTTQPDGDLSSPTLQTTSSGTSHPVWYLYSLHPNCSTAGKPVVEIIKAASHGSVIVQNVDHFTEYLSTNERFKCNTTSSPSVAVVYTPEKTFVGIDNFVVQGTFPSGLIQVKSFVLNVAEPQAALGEQSSTQQKAVAASTPPRVDFDHPLKVGQGYYPAESLRAREEGQCLVQVTVMANGRFKDVHILHSSGYPRLDKACVDAFDGGRFIPATENGVAIEKTISFPVVWRLAF